MNQGSAPTHPLLALIDLGQQARRAGSLDELLFLLVNGSKALGPYRQAWHWHSDQGISHVSGVVVPERHSPFMQWALAVSRHLSGQAHEGVRTVGRADLPAALAADWGRWMPSQAWWFPLNVGERAARGLLVAAEALDPQHLPLWQEWIEIWALAAERQVQREHASLSGALRRWVRHPRAVGPGLARSRWFWLALALAGLAWVPVPLTVIGQGELVARQPVVVRAPLDGVIHEFHVSPNQQVKAGEALFSYDNEAVRSRLLMAQQSLASALAEYRQTAQSALNDARAKFQMAALVGKVQEKQAELKFLSEQVHRTTVVAPQAGVVIFDEVAEWIGKPVQTGERVMRIADPGDVELEVWVSLADALPLKEGNQAKLFLAASPLRALPAKVRWVGYEAQARPDGNFAYRLRATLNDPSDAMVGAKGTARISSGEVPLIYWLLRKPLAVLRAYLLV